MDSRRVPVGAVDPFALVVAELWEVVEGRCGGRRVGGGCGWEGEGVRRKLDSRVEEDGSDENGVSQVGAVGEGNGIRGAAPPNLCQNANPRHP